MPVCPNCEYEYVEGVTICPDCHEVLVDESLFIKPEDWKEDNWVVVYTTDQNYEAEMIKDNLESAGITAAVLSQKDRNFPAPGDLTVVRVLVRKEEMASALNFIEEVKKSNESNEEEE